MEAIKILKVVVTMKENIENNPVRLYKKEPISLSYNKATVYLTGAVFIIMLVIIAFVIGTENFNILFWSCI